jgi:hypothetical protein
MLLGVGAGPPGRALGRLGAGLGGTAAAGLAGPPLTSGTALAVRFLAPPVNLRIQPLGSSSLTKISVEDIRNFLAWTDPRQDPIFFDRIMCTVKLANAMFRIRIQ